MRINVLTMCFWSILVLVSCNRKTAEPIATAPIEKRPSPTQVPKATEAPLDVVSLKPHLVASIRKTPCYGECPVYEAKFYSDGRATYHGRKFVDREGYYVAVIEEAFVADILKKAKELGYFKLDVTYPVSGHTITDLPNVITSVNDGKQEKSITNNHEAPNNLLDFERFLEEKMNSLEWSEVEKFDE